MESSHSSSSALSVCCASTPSAAAVSVSDSIPLFAASPSVRPVPPPSPSPSSSSLLSPTISELYSLPPPSSDRGSLTDIALNYVWTFPFSVSHGGHGRSRLRSVGDTATTSPSPTQTPKSKRGSTIVDISTPVPSSSSSVSASSSSSSSSCSSFSAFSPPPSPSSSSGALSGSWTLHGRSRAADATGFVIPELNFALDCGTPQITPAHPDYVFIGHTHSDHVVRATRMKSRRKPPSIFLPKSAVSFLDQYLMTYQQMTDNRPLDPKHPHDKSYELIGVEAGDSLPLKRGGHMWRVDIVGCDHSVPSVGYLFTETKSRLKPQYTDFAGKDIASLRKSGVEVMMTVDRPLFGFMGDTTHKVFEWHPEIFKFPVVITECTFLDEKTHAANAVRTKHTLWRDLEPIVVAHPDTIFILIHFSLRYKESTIRQFFSDFVRLSNVVVWIDHSRAPLPPLPLPGSAAVPVGVNGDPPHGGRINPFDLMDSGERGGNDEDDDRADSTPPTTPQHNCGSSSSSAGVIRSTSPPIVRSTSPKQQKNGGGKPPTFKQIPSPQHTKNRRSYSGAGGGSDSGVGRAAADDDSTAATTTLATPVLDATTIAAAAALAEPSVGTL